MRAEAWLGAAAVAAALLGAGPARAQLPPDTTLVYRRELFHYARAGRADPFRSLLGGTELGVRVEELTLRGVVHSSDPSRSVAVLEQTGNDKRIRARVGDRIGGVRIVAIQPRSIEVVIEELGVARRVTLELKPAQARPGGEKGSGR